MKTSRSSSTTRAWAGAVAMTLVALLGADRAAAQDAPERVVHSFAGGLGAYPDSPLALGADGALYGVATFGGRYHQGSVYKIDAQGHFKVLHAFQRSGDGADPWGRLLLASDGNFYGTTRHGGAFGRGTVYRMSPDGALEIVHSFTGNDMSPQVPMTGLVQGRDGSLYGTTFMGGRQGVGAVFKMTLAGEMTVLHEFKAGTDGSQPQGELLLASDGSIYGTTVNGGVFCGTVFRLAPGDRYRVVHAFQWSSEDGCGPSGGLVEGAPGTFFGTTTGGGANQAGTVFAMTAAGAVTVLHSFEFHTTEGQQPMGSLLRLADGALVGTTTYGGVTNNGTVFRIDAAGAYGRLHDFDVDAGDGAGPENGLTLGADGLLYGTTHGGGSTWYGTVYQLTP